MNATPLAFLTSTGLRVVGRNLRTRFLSLSHAARNLRTRFLSLSHPARNLRTRLPSLFLCPP
jgi:hypothetical protein